MMCVSILQAGVYLKASGTRYLREDSFSNAFVPRCVNCEGSLTGTIDESAVLLLYVDIIGIKFGRSSRVLHHRVSAKFKQPPLHHFTTTLLLLFLFLSVVCSS